jgi:hypothetical protein
MIRQFVLLNEDVYGLLVNDSNKGSPKFLERNLSQCHIFHYKSHMDWLQIEVRIPR